MARCSLPHLVISAPMRRWKRGLATSQCTMRDQVEKLFRAEVLRLLIERGKIGDEVVESLLAWRHSGFSVHAAVRVEQRQEAARLGRYGIRCPLVLDRLAWDETAGQVVDSARPSRRDGAGASVARWDVLDFLARVLDHLPEPRGGLIAPTGRLHPSRRKSGFLHGSRSKSDFLHGFLHGPRCRGCVSTRARPRSGAISAALRLDPKLDDANEALDKLG